MVDKTSPTAQPALRSLLPEELSSLLVGAGFEAYRGKQVFQWLHAKSVRSIDEMVNVPKKLRDWLSENTRLGGATALLDERRSDDGSSKFLFQFADGRKVESVLMPDPKRAFFTMCVSSQVGCAVDCKFCLTGRNGFFRNMTADEIADQVLWARRILRERDPDAIFRNIVYMGMGEPLLNTAAVVRSIRLLTHSEGADFSPRRITVSTSGILPGLAELAAAETNVGLAISLNAVTQELREQVMPITRKYPLDELLEAAANFPLRPGRRITFEYVLLAGVNDSIEDARIMARILRGIPCKINLIPFNANPLLPYARPEREQVDRFQEVLSAARYTVSTRWSKAQDVSGACGNLATEFRQGGGVRAGAAAPAAVASASEGHDLDFFTAGLADDEED